MRHWFTLSVLVLSIFANGCANDGSTLFIVSNLSLDDNCTYASGNPVRASGTLDVARIGVDQGYTMFPLIGAQLIERASDRDVNPFDLTVTGIDVRLEDEGGATLDLGGLANPYRVRTNTFIEAFSGSGNIPTGVAEVEVIPPLYANALAGLGRVIVVLRPVGRTTGGISVQGAFHFSYPVDICIGCTAGCFLPDGEASVACLSGQDEVDRLTECVTP